MYLYWYAVAFVVPYIALGSNTNENFMFKFMQK